MLLPPIQVGSKCSQQATGGIFILGPERGHPRSRFRLKCEQSPAFFNIGRFVGYR